MSKKTEQLKDGKVSAHFPVVIQSENHLKLLAIQSYPETKYFFKDEEVTLVKLIKILESANP